MTKVELYEVIRRDVKVNELSIRAAARRRGVHRRAVRQALDSAVPPPRRKPVREPPVFTTAMRGVVDRWLEEDRVAPRKQRHTARRIRKRLVEEHGFTGAESTVRKYVGQRRRELGLGKQVFVPQTHVAGEEAEVDWYEAQVDFPEGRRKVHVLSMRSCYSGREFHMAFPRETQQAFLEGHVEAFAAFGGVFHTVRYDNLTSAVKRVLRGRRRKETDRFVALRSHYLYESAFCRPGKEGAHEKGGVEGGLGRFRRTHLVPVPVVKDFDELNGLLLDGYAADEQRRIEGRTTTVGEDWEQERPRLRELPGERFDTSEVSTHRVDQKSRVRARTNHYSVPVRLAGRLVEMRLDARQITVVHDGKVAAVHDRLYGRHGQSLHLDHYLELLERKPGALEGATPLVQARQAGTWPEQYDRLWGVLQERYGATEAARQMVDVVMLHRQSRPADVHTAVGLALEYGCCELGAVKGLLRQLEEPEHIPPHLEQLGALGAFGVPASTDMSAYDVLCVSSASMQEVA